MRRALLIPTIVALIAILASCTRAPRLTTGDSREEIRREYLAKNPDGQFNQYILKGEVAKGMTVIEVLASWGVPNVRRGSDADTDEYWTYYALDQHSGNVISYKLTFHDRVLKSWAFDANVAGMGTLTPRDLITSGPGSAGGLGDDDTGTTGGAGAGVGRRP